MAKTPAKGPGDLTDKQARFVEEQLRYVRIAALRKIAMHIGLIAPARALRPSEAVLEERIAHYGEDFVEAVLMVVADDTAAPHRRAAAGVILECFIPDWREIADPRLVGMVVERGDAEVAAWRKEVLNRDGHACVKCGETEGLEAHHVVRWADAPNLRVVPENGMTLCARCHRKEHAHA